MYVSKGSSNTRFVPVEMKSFKALCDLMLDQNNRAYSLGTFTNDYRNKKNFIKTKCIGLDVDNDSRQTMTLEQAKEKFKEYRHIIATSKSHQIEKNGTTTDRFRVILFFENEVTTSDEFYRAWFGLESEFPEIDPTCKDPSRFWYPSKDIIEVQKEGKYVQIPDAVEPEIVQPEKTDIVLGKLSYNTMKFFCVGAEPGNCHNMLFKTTTDCREQGYPKTYVVGMIQNMIDNTGKWPTDKVSENDLKTIDDVYNRTLKYDKRAVDSPFNFQHISVTLQDDTEIEWLVKDLLTVGGFSLIAGQPKSGKSTIIRQLCVTVAQGGTFLGREVQQGRVNYLAIEEQPGMIRNEITRQGAKMDAPLYMHYGPCGHDMEILEAQLIENEVKLLVIDTMALFLGAEDINSYSAVNKLMADCRNVARNSGTHICMIHHQNKSDIGGAKTIMGSNAIHGAIDNAIIFESAGKFRFLTTSQRGGKRFIEAKLDFNPTTLRYKLAKSTQSDDDNDGF